MATIQLKLPKLFNFKTPDEWAQWHKRFEQFRIASGLGEDSSVKQVSTFLYCQGEDAESVLTSMNLTEVKRKNFDAVMSKFDAFFKVHRNLIYERVRLN